MAGSKRTKGAQQAQAKPSRLAERQALKELGIAQCSLDEAAIIMGRSGWRVRFNAPDLRAYEKGRAIGLKELRKAQFDMAKKNVPMATMLGKFYLGQDQRREQNETAPIDYATIKERHRDRVSAIVAAEDAEPD